METIKKMKIKSQKNKDFKEVVISLEHKIIIGIEEFEIVNTRKILFNKSRQVKNVLTFSNKETQHNLEHLQNN